MSKKKAEDPIRVLEIVSHVGGGFEIRMAQFETNAIPIIVGLLEKAKFDLLARDFDEEGAADELPPVINRNNKFDA